MLSYEQQCKRVQVCYARLGGWHLDVFPWELGLVHVSIYLVQKKIMYDK
jgi:hypothetical protein